MMTREADLQRAVMDLAKLHGLLVHHCRPARMQSGKWGESIPDQLHAISRRAAS